MGSTSVADARKWLQQCQPVPDRVASLIMRCARDGMVPGEIRMSSDLYSQMAEAAIRGSNKEFDPENIPTTLNVSIGGHKLKLVHKEEMPLASMHAVR